MQPLQSSPSPSLRRRCRPPLLLAALLLALAGAAGFSGAACSEGQWYNATADACLPCADGHWSDELRYSVDDYYQPYHDPTCAGACAAGSFSNANHPGKSAACTACFPGTYAASDAAGVCDACAAGTFSGAGFVQCATCRAGTFSAAGSAACLACVAGTASSARAATCTACPAGYYSDTGKAVCTPCAVGSFAVHAGSGTGSSTGSGFHFHRTGSGTT